MIKNILLDLDDTIFDFKKAEAVAVSKTLRELGIEPTDEIVSLYSSINQAQWKLLELGELTRDRIRVRRYELLFKELGADLDPLKASDIYADFLSQGHYYVNHAHEMLEQLHGTYRLYIASNGFRKIQRGRIASSDLDSFISDYFLSEEVGSEKPSREFFAYCLEHISGANKANTAIVGDSLTSDIKGGEAFGIPTVWFNPRKSANTTPVTPTATVSDLLEVPKVIARL